MRSTVLDSTGKKLALCFITHEFVRWALTSPPCVHHLQSSDPHINSSCRPHLNYCLAGNFHWVQIFAIFTDWSATVKCKPWKMNQARNFENCCDNLTIASARKKYSIIVVATWLFALSSQCRFWLGLTWEVPGLHVLRKRRGNHLVGVWLEWLAFREIKTMKISPGESGGISVKFCTKENFI